MDDPRIDALWDEASDWCDGDRDLMWDWLACKFLGIEGPDRVEPLEWEGLFSDDWVPPPKKPRSVVVAERRDEPASVVHRG